VVRDRSGVTRRTPFQSYWKLADFTAKYNKFSYDEAVAGIEERLAAAVASHRQADVKVGALLSGGLDSSTLVGLARVRGAAMHDQLGFADALRAVFSRPRGPKEGSRTKTASLRRASASRSLPRSLAADFLVRSPEEDEAFAKRRFRLLKRVQREKRLNDSGLHVESARAVSCAAFYAKRHFGERSGRVDRIVVA